MIESPGESHAGTGGSSLRRLEATVLLLAVLATGVFFTWIGDAVARDAPSWLLPLDDSYIFLRYARQGARGDPLEWNPGEPSTGASSFLYPWLETPAFWIDDDPAFVSRWAFWLGAIGLWLAGMGGARLLRVFGTPDPWPVAGGLSLVWSGPLVFGSLGGMESALNAAAILWALALWVEASRAGASRSARTGALVLVALLPWLRPENGALTVLAALALFAGRGPSVPRAIGGLLLLPGAFLAGLDLAISGHLSPAGALAKSRLGAPFVGPIVLASLYGHGFVEWILPVYLGAHPYVLPPPIGWLAVAAALVTLVTAFGRLLRPSRIDWKCVRPTAIAWLVLLLLAPLSSLVHWHYWRHHHAGIALAWVLALALLAVLTERWRKRRSARWRAVALVAPLVLFLGLPSWGLRYAEGMDVLWRRNGPAAAWLQGLRGQPVLLVNDAGLLSLGYEGPMIDAVGLGSNDLALPFRHGPGSLLESLARREPLPQIAAVHPEMFRVPDLLGERLREPDAPGALEIARVRQDLLRATRLGQRGLDFGLLRDEERLAWDPTPHPNYASFALLRDVPDKDPFLGGCRPLPGTVRVPLDSPRGPFVLRATALDERPTAVVLRILSAAGESLFRREAPLDPDSWIDLEIPLPPGSPSHLELVRSAPGMPCLESLIW